MIADVDMTIRSQVGAEAARSEARTRLDDWREPLFRPVDIRSLAVFRILFGSLMVVAVLRYFAYGWIDELFIRPKYFFTYSGFEWIHPWPGAGMYVHFTALGVLAVMIAVGLATRTSAALFFVGFTYAQLIDKTNYLNHYYLVSLLAFLLIFLPSGRAWSLDARLQPDHRLDLTPQWTIWLLRFQLALVYFFAGVAKLDADWLLAGQPLRTWLAGFSDVAVVGSLLAHPWTASLMSLAGAIFDLTIVAFLLTARVRPFAYAAVVIFHLATAALFPIGIFPWLMIGLSTIFFGPDWPARFMNRANTEGTPCGASTPHNWRVPIVAALAIYSLVQVMVPLRFLTRAGDVRWTEDGFRYAWRVMLIEKIGSAKFTVVDRQTGRSESIEPRQYLSPLQAHMMSTQPDMILQFAHWLGAQRHAVGSDVEVHADVHVSFNGRRHRPLVDPSLDLLTISTSSPHAQWLQPLDLTRAEAPASAP